MNYNINVYFCIVKQWTKLITRDRAHTPQHKYRQTPGKGSRQGKARHGGGKEEDGRRLIKKTYKIPLPSEIKYLLLHGVSDAHEKYAAQTRKMEQTY